MITRSGILIARTLLGTVITRALNHEVEADFQGAKQSHFIIAETRINLQIASQAMILLLSIIMVARNDAAVVVADSNFYSLSETALIFISRPGTLILKTLPIVHTTISLPGNVIASAETHELKADS